MANQVEGAAKYSLDVDISVTMEDGTVTVVEFSFGTSDRTDGLDISEPNLCVPLSAFVYDLNADGEIEQVYGPAYVKVKALDPGKDKGRQNNEFSEGLNIALNAQETP